MIQLELTPLASFMKGSEPYLVMSAGDDDSCPFLESHVLKAQGLLDLELLAVNSYGSIQKPASSICSCKGKCDNSLWVQTWLPSLALNSSNATHFSWSYM